MVSLQQTTQGRRKVKFKMFSTDGQGTDFEGFQIEADSYAEALKEMCGLDGIR